MKQWLQDLRSGQMTVQDVPTPGGVLIGTRLTLISAGTERMLVEFFKGSLLAKAQAERVRHVLQKIKTGGLLPTLEAFTLTVIEAMAAGLPVLVASTTSFPEVVGSAGLYHEPTRQAEVARNLLRVVEDAEVREKLRRLSLQRLTRYNWGHAAKRYISCLEAAMDRTSTAAIRVE